MNFKKIILVLLLIFSLVSLFVIVYFSKNRIGMFGRIYDEHVKKNTELITRTIQTNVGIIKNEINYLSQEEIVRNIFEAHYLSLSELDGNKINEIKAKISDCNKIQLINREGLVVFSTASEENLSQKIKESVLTKIVKHFSYSETPFFYFLNNQQFVVIQKQGIVVSNELKEGYIAIYYNSNKLINGLPTKKVKVPFSYENFLFLSKGNIDKKDLNLIIENYEQLKDNKKEGLEKTIGAISQFDGIKIVYYSKNEKFVSPWTILFIIIDLILLLLVIFTLFQLFREEKMYQEVALKTLKTDTVDSNHSEIGDLVRDIEEENIVRSDIAEEGIEKMIMQNNVDLYATPSDITKEDKTSYIEPSYEEPKTEEATFSFEPIEETSLPEVEPISLSEEKSPEKIFKDYSELEPNNETKLFAEQENIFQEVTNDYIEKEESLKGITAEETAQEVEKLKEIEESIEFDIPEVENIQVENMADNLTQLEEATAIEQPKVETIEEMEADLKNVMEEPPQKISTIATVEDYGNVARELAKNYLGMTNISILKRENNHFSTVIKDGFKNSNISFDINDPLVSLFLSKGKSVDIKGNLDSKYVKSKFNESDIKNLEEIFIVPIAKKGELVGVGFFGREKGVKEPTNFQKSELFNMGYLQEE
ncbi:MAG: hypothetical protein N2258_03105 [Brevinematales bacterium]|nr:hypothetical protein [Brevinematales bacterium]